MTTFTETLPHAGGFLISEANGDLSREVVTLDTGNLTAGTVLGQITTGTATPAAVAGNTGSSGTIASAAVGATAKVGVYHVVCVEPGSNAGKFTVEDPDGITIGVATVAVEFVGGGLTFTITDATDFVSGDSFTITVAAGSGKYVQFNQDATNGSQHAAAILFREADATSADVSVTVIKRLATVTAAELVWPSDIDAGEKTAALAELAALDIIAR